MCALLCFDAVDTREFYPYPVGLVVLGKKVYPLDSKVHGADIGPTWGRQDPGGPYVGPMNIAIWANASETVLIVSKFVTCFNIDL